LRRRLSGYPSIMTVIAAVRGVVPHHRYEQGELTAAFSDVVFGAAGTGAGSDRTALLHRFHEATGVDTRHLALPLAAYAGLTSFTATNDAFLDVGVGLGDQAIRAALDAAGLRPDDVDHIMSVSVTGIGVPSLDARLVSRLGLRTDVKRIPVFGLGCVAGVAGISRLHDVLRGDPDGVAVLLSVELCSLTVQHNDVSTANLIASGLFGDGAADVVLVGDRRAAAMGLTGPRVLDTLSRFYPDTERVMGWDIGESGFRIVLAPTVADVVEKYLREDVDGFLAGHRLGVADVTTWVTHPGGPKVIEAILRALDLPAAALAVTRECLTQVGNLSSASVLHVLDRTLRAGLTRPATPGVMIAMGPGFCAELVLLRW
jgi:alkylresorcinol/alkylpyrone synthase